LFWGLSNLAKPTLFVAFTSDTEDNHPDYVPLWKGCGSNYDKNPADLKWTWSQYWDSLSDVFKDNNVPVTWLLRVDKGPVFDQMLVQFRNEIINLKAIGDEIGIHVHTFEWNSNLSKWIQTQDPKKESNIIIYSLEAFKRNLGFAASSIRMGWNTMSNEIMRTIDSQGLKVDASAIPGTSCPGKFSSRDNIYDWTRTPYVPYHPNSEDYQSPGNMQITEIPLAILQKNKSDRLGKIVNRLSNFKSLAKLLPLARCFGLSPHNHFYISPYWSQSKYDTLIEAYSRQANNNGVAFFVGYFHACDILDPLTSKRNSTFEKYLRRIIEKLQSVSEVEVKFETLSNLANDGKTSVQ
jgi:hypothetical protein